MVCFTENWPCHSGTGCSVSRDSEMLRAKAMDLRSLSRKATSCDYIEILQNSAVAKPVISNGTDVNPNTVRQYEPK